MSERVQVHDTRPSYYMSMYRQMSITGQILGILLIIVPMLLFVYFVFVEAQQIPIL